MIACCVSAWRFISQPLVRKERCKGKIMSNPISRRGFLKQLNCAAVGTSAILNTLLNLKLANSVAAQSGPLDNKALVCIFLSGGMDSFNMLVPWEQSRYDTYSVTRGVSGSDGG